MRIEANGLAELIESMQARQERVVRLEPALMAFGQYIVKETDDKFQDSVDWDGEPFEPLKDSTLEQRARSYAAGKGGVRGARKTLRAKLKAEGKRGKEVRKALKQQRVKYLRKQIDFALQPGAVKILVDTARARNSNHVGAPEPTSITWSAVGYLGFHMTGTKRMPERNPSAFVFEANEWKLHPIAAAEFDRVMRSYVVTGRVAS